MSLSKSEAVAVIIFDEKKTKILLIQRRDIPVWVLPGGGVEKDETPEDAAKREALEETGFEIALRRKIAEYISVNSFTRPTHFFEGAILSGEPTTGKETKTIRFFSLDDLPLLPPPYKGWIKDACLFHPDVLRKKIEGVSYWVFCKLLIQHPILVCRYLLTKLGIHLNSGTNKGS